MIVSRLLLVATLAITAYAQEDLKLAYELSECLRDAATEGIPSIGIPSHNPLRINRELSWNGDIGVASATLNMSNIVWHGIPSWNISIDQLSKDSDAVAVFAYDLHWKKFVITSEYTLQTNVVLIPAEISGHLNITLEGNDWAGVVNYTKPGFNLTEEIEYLELKWNADAVDFNFTGLGIINDPVSQTMGGLVKSYFDSGALKNALGELLQEKLNTVWFEHHDRIDVVLDFCKDKKMHF